jgi:hypothetical protein
MIEKLVQKKAEGESWAQESSVCQDW